MNFAGYGASWIWDKSNENSVNKYVQFRHDIFLDMTGIDDAMLHISADSDYAVWINGVFADCGQYDDYPDNKIYDTISVGKLLRKGKNSLCIMVYYQGEDSFQYICGDPGLIYILEAGGKLVCSGSDVQCRADKCYRMGRIDKITMQLSFLFEYDAGMSDGWLDRNYKTDGSWHQPYVYEAERVKKRILLNQRPILKLNIKDRLEAKIVACGFFNRLTSINNRLPFDNKSIAELVYTDFLSSRRFCDIFQGDCNDVLDGKAGRIFRQDIAEAASGIYLIIDLGREECGLLELELKAEKGTLIDIAYGEHLDDLRVRACVGGRNFANRYICGAGRQKFTHYFKRLAGRYIELHLSNIKGETVLYYAGIRPVEYPVAVRGDFTCCDGLHNNIYEVGVRTLHLCMHEHYEDTPWREQGLYTMDSRNQALCGYYCFGEYDFPQASFELLGQGLKQDGYLELCAPSRQKTTIPCFSMLWIIELAEHMMYSGRIEAANKVMPRVKSMLESYVAKLQNDIYPTFRNERYWNFYEWVYGLDGNDETIGFNEDGFRIDAIMNLFLSMALDSAALIANELGEYACAERYKQFSKRIKEAFHKLFWDGQRNLYRTYAVNGSISHFAELTQALAVCSGACSEDIAIILRKKLATGEKDCYETTLSHSYFKFEALMCEPEKYAKNVFENIAHDWGKMLFKGSTSFWETIEGADDFEKAGSLCHGWSAIPVYFYHKYVLGISPVKPGFKEFNFKPVTTVFNRASGSVPTPYGDICVDWAMDGNVMKHQISAPEKTILL